MLRKRSDRTIPPPIRPTQHFPIQLWLIRLTVHRKRRIFKMGGKQIARVRFFHGPPQTVRWADCMACTHTQRERSVSSRNIPSVCVCVCMWLRFIFIPNNRNWCSSRLSHTSSSCVCVCVLLLLFSFIRFITHGRHLPPHTTSHKTDRCETLCWRKYLDKEILGVFQKGERDDTENQRVNDEVCIRKKGGGSALQQRSKRGRSSPDFTALFIRGNSFTRQKSLASLSQYMNNNKKKTHCTTEGRDWLCTLQQDAHGYTHTHTHLGFSLFLFVKGSIEWNETGQQFKRQPICAWVVYFSCHRDVVVVLQWNRSRVQKRKPDTLFFF